MPAAEAKFSHCRMGANSAGSWMFSRVEAAHDATLVQARFVCSRFEEEGG